MKQTINTWQRQTECKLHSYHKSAQFLGLNIEDTTLPLEQA